MKRNLRRWIMCVSVFLALCISNTVGAEEKTGQDNEVSKKAAVSQYDESIKRAVNAPMYNYYAQKIKEKTGIIKGVCLDVGSGGGYLGLALVKITDLDFIFLDISPEAIEKVKANIVADGLQKRARTIVADVHKIPLPDGSVNLVISRGSIPFWKDPGTAFKEIYRVLAPGGKAYIGGGKGTPEIQAQIAAKRKELGMEPQFKLNLDKDAKVKGPRKFPPRDYNEILKGTGITTYTANKGEWILIWK